jgi:hypothetical protein
MIKLDLYALTFSKYYDSLNHNYPTVQFIDIKNKEKFKVYFINEKSGFFDSIGIGDTVIKKAGSLELWTSNLKTISPLSYDCPDEMKK